MRMIHSGAVFHDVTDSSEVLAKLNWLERRMTERFTKEGWATLKEVMFEEVDRGGRKVVLVKDGYDIDKIAGTFLANVLAKPGEARRADLVHLIGSVAYYPAYIESGEYKYVRCAVINNFSIQLSEKFGGRIHEEDWQEHLSRHLPRLMNQQYLNIIADEYDKRAKLNRDRAYALRVSAEKLSAPSEM